MLWARQSFVGQILGCQKPEFGGFKRNKTAWCRCCKNIYPTKIVKRCMYFSLLTPYTSVLQPMFFQTARSWELIKNWFWKSRGKVFFLLDPSRQCSQNSVVEVAANIFVTPYPGCTLIYTVKYIKTHLRPNRSFWRLLLRKSSKIRYGNKFPFQLTKRGVTLKVFSVLKELQSKQG